MIQSQKYYCDIYSTYNKMLLTIKCDNIYKKDKCILSITYHNGIKHKKDLI